MSTIDVVWADGHRDSWTPAELAVLRKFRAAMREELDKVQADLIVDVHVRQYRHDCRASGGKSTALELREHYVLSPGYHVLEDGEIREAGNAFVMIPGSSVVPARRFGWIFTRGRCPACKVTARSSRGRLVDPAVRPPDGRAIVS